MGNFDRQHILVQWGGKLPGNEEWSCGIRMANNFTGDNTSTMPDSSDLQSWLDGAVATAVKEFHQRPATKIHGAAKLSFVKANIIKSDGHYLDTNTHEHVYPDHGGGGSSPLYPNQVALVVSLTTAVGRGPAHRGRFYLPLPTLALDGATGLALGADCAEIAGSAKAFIEALSDTPGVDTSGAVNAVVMSRKTGAPATHRVTGIEVGRVLDTQRRRRRSLLEDYSKVAVDTGVF